MKNTPQPGNTTKRNTRLNDRRQKALKDGNPAGALNVDLDRHRALLLRLEGHTYREIGAALGVSGKTAHGWVNDAWDRINLETDEERRLLRDIEADRLDAGVRVAMRLLTTEDLFVKDTDAKGAVVYLDAAELKLKAIDRLVKISKRRSELFGLDAPVKFEQTGGSALEPLEVLQARVEAAEKAGRPA